MIKKWITCDREILSGKPIIKGDAYFRGAYSSMYSFRNDYRRHFERIPNLKREAVFAALEFAAHQMDGEEIRILEKV